MAASLARAMGGSEALRAARESLRDRDAWLVGGTVRDLLMDRPLEDLDLAVSEGAEEAARSLAQATRANVFPLSERFGAWRVIAADRGWQADVTPVRGGSIEADLALRDFTVNSMAVPLAGGGEGEVIDPRGGRADLEAGVLRVTAESAYREDPLRTLRMARLACELDLEPEPRTRALAVEAAGAITSVAPERSFYELRRLVTADRVLHGIHLMEEARLIDHLLPELAQLRGVEQNPYHHLDVWGHTLAVLEALLEIERDPEPVLGERSGAVLDELRRPLADDLTRGEALRFGALLHDIGKPGTRRVAEGRVLFIGHDQLGADLTRSICRRLHTSVPLAEFLAALAQHHLRLGFLVHERPLSRHSVYRYLRACEPVELEVTVLSVADRLATRGERTRDEAVTAHVDLARELAAEALAWRAGQFARAPVDGHDLMRELGMEPGPEVGRLLEVVREAAFAGEVSSRAEALALARTKLSDDS